MNYKKTVLLLAVLLFAASGTFANPIDDNTDSMMQKIKKQIEQTYIKISHRQPQAPSQVDADLNQSPSLQQAKPPQTNEICAETGHSQHQAKNHKGPCTWINLAAQKAHPQSRHYYNSKTGEHVFVHANGNIWKWKDVPAKTGAAEFAPKDTTSSKEKYPVYW